MQSRHRILRTVALLSSVLVVTASACGGDGIEERAAAVRDDLQVAAAPTAPTDTTTPAAATPSQLSAGRIDSVAALHDAARAVASSRPEFAATIRELQPTPTRNRALLRFSGIEHQDADAAVLFAERLLDEPNTSTAQRVALADVLTRTGASPELAGDLVLLTLADEDDAAVRRTLVSKFARMNSEFAAEGLPLALEDVDDGVREEAVYALASHPELGDLHGRLIERLEDPSAVVRASAARSLGVLKYAPALEPLRSHLASDDADERLSSLRAIGRIDADYAAGLDLTRLMDDADSRVANEATRIAARR